MFDSCRSILIISIELNSILSLRTKTTLYSIQTVNDHRPTVLEQLKVQ